MSRFRLTIQGKQLQKRSVEKLVRSLKDLKKKGEICAGAAEGGQNPRLKLRGGKYDHFEFAPAGVVYCPEP